MEYKNKWSVTASYEQMINDSTVCEIAKELGITVPTAQLLVNRGCMSPDEAKGFLKKETESMHDPFLMLDMDNAAYRIIEAVENKEKITIYGDYDVDGVTSVSILYLYLKSYGANVSYYIPCRSGEGYGMSEAAVRRLSEEGCNLIITVDTGITAVNEAVLAHELGMELVITDHHECHSEIPKAEAVVNPRRPDCTYPFKELAGVGVVFKLLCAMEAVWNPEMSMKDAVYTVSKEYLDLVAIGTIADVMPIKDENRLIVSYGLKLIENSTRPGLEELIEATRTDSKFNTKKKITASFIGYTIAPRINAAGRIRDASIAVELFLASDRAKAAEIAKKLCDINRERQAEENKITESVYAQIAASYDLERDRVIVLDDETWHHGIIGIVASRITEKYGLPSILISFEGSDGNKGPEDLGKGSGRSVKGMNLVDGLSYCSDLLEKFGGHELAAGLTVKRENLEKFRKKINEYAAHVLKDTDTKVQIEAECELTPSDVTMEQANELYYLEPHGVSNPVPVFLMKNILLEDVSLVGGGKHTRLSVKIKDKIVSAMCFRQTLSDLDIYPGDIVDIMFGLDINEFQNQRNLQLIVKDVRLTESQFERENAERTLFANIKAGMSPYELGLDENMSASLVPTHDEFGKVYNVLKRELRVEHEVFSMRALLNLLKSVGVHIGYVKLKIILMTFSELNILGVKELDAEHEIYAFRYIYLKTKTNLEKSNIYRNFKSNFQRRTQ